MRDGAPRSLACVTDNREHFAPWDPDRDLSNFILDRWWTPRDGMGAAWRAGTRPSLVLESRTEPPSWPPGNATLSQTVGGPIQAAALGYALDHRQVGRGFMREAFEAAIGFVFAAFRLRRVMADRMPTNVCSGVLPRRPGVVPEGCARDDLRLAGTRQDHALRFLTNPDWRPPEVRDPA